MMTRLRCPAHGAVLAQADAVAHRRGNRVKLAKKHIIDLFVVRGDLDRAERADRLLPDLVDLSENADAMRALGLDPALLAIQIDNLEAT
ncbi:MAG TPA: hypothetical protein VFZ70_07690 [Euzebyales bacterium]